MFRGIELGLCVRCMHVGIAQTVLVEHSNTHFKVASVLYIHNPEVTSHYIIIRITIIVYSSTHQSGEKREGVLMIPLPYTLTYRWSMSSSRLSVWPVFNAASWRLYWEVTCVCMVVHPSRLIELQKRCTPKPTLVFPHKGGG